MLSTNADEYFDTLENKNSEEKVFSYEISWDFILTILRLQEYFVPLTARKGKFLILYVLILGLILSLEFTVGLSKYIIYGLTETTILPLMIVLYGIEPVLFCFSMLITRYPIANQVSKKTEISTGHVQFDHQAVAIIIPAHNSENEIRSTILSCLNVVRPHQIFVIDNGNSPEPTDKTKEVIKGISDEIVYYWHPYGNKTVAQYIGSKYLASRFKYCICLDDDMRFPINYQLDISLFSKKYKAIIYPIRAISGGKGSTILLRWQDIEYQLSDHYKMFEDKFHGVLFPHGAICAWKRKTLCRVLIAHNTRFIAEDIQSGLICEHLGFKKHIDVRYHFETVAPYSLLGKPLNLYQQRVRGWSIGAQTINHLMLRALLFEWHLNPLNLAVLKVSQSYALYSNLVDWLRFFVIIAMASNPIYWAELVGINVVQQLLTIFWNYVKLSGRPDLQHDSLTVSTFFVYRLLNQVFASLGLLRLLFIYLPNLSPAKNIGELEKDGSLANVVKFALELNGRMMPNDHIELNETIIEMPLDIPTDNHATIKMDYSSSSRTGLIFFNNHSLGVKNTDTINERYGANHNSLS